MFFKKKKYDFYLAGPMRGYPNLNKEMFTKMVKFLRLKGFTVWNPSEHTSYLKLSFAECMTLDLNMVICCCNKIAFLPGWRESLGANMEAFAAFACGKEAIELIPLVSGDVAIVSLNLTEYNLPYIVGETCRFDPHKT
ncbi:MAG: DUF4406 domain-containing protein [Candidatus Heimdallarchaeota archaeon]|nr:MAG: DUF4406 domain-containing protein [Candidatus Heimdallarchaeota archaeon]